MERVGRPLVEIRADLVTEGTDQGGGAREGDRGTEKAAEGAVRGSELGLLGPGAAQGGENVGRPLVGSEPTSWPLAPIRAVVPEMETE